jgi:hypothetical protein
MNEYLSQVSNLAGWPLVRGHSDGRLSQFVRGLSEPPVHSKWYASIVFFFFFGNAYLSAQ